MMFGYATNRNGKLHAFGSRSARILKELSAIRREDSEDQISSSLMQKSGVTIEYSDDHKPVRIDSIVVSTQHDDFAGGVGRGWVGRLKVFFDSLEL